MQAQARVRTSQIALIVLTAATALIDLNAPSSP
jgi:hypothetical protein